MPSPRDPEKFFTDELGVSRGEAREALRNSLRDFDLRLPQPQVKIEPEVEKLPIREEQAGFGLPTKPTDAPVTAGSPGTGSSITLKIFINGGLSEQSFLTL